MTTVLVPPRRVERWFENFGHRHGSFTLSVEGGALHAVAEDGATAVARLPWSQEYAGAAEPARFAEAAAAEVSWGVLLVRKGGFAVAAGTGPAPAYSKVGRRHVQGKTKAGGWSQQRYARRRDNQAREAFEAAAGHAHRILVESAGGVAALVCGGDRAAVEATLEDPRLAGLARVRVDRWLPVGDPGADVLRDAVRDAQSVEIVVEEPAGPGQGAGHGGHGAGQGAAARTRESGTNE